MPSVVLVHNSYLERGGEDVSFEEEKRLLVEKGHAVRTYLRHNQEILSYNIGRKLAFPINTIWARASHADMRELLREARPTICHFNNTFPLISPSAYDACREAGVPVVQNLRNYRLICPNGYLYRDHAICEECVGKRVPWPAVVHACYRDSRLQSAVVATMLSYHRAVGTWANKVDAYIALTEFSRRKLIEGGLPTDRVFVKPNFAFDRGHGARGGDYAVFVGRLTDVKGINSLLSAWSRCHEIPLKIIGDGPLAPEMTLFLQANHLANVDLVGQLPSKQTIEMVRAARFLIFPSVWYEAFPRVLLESFSCARPVVASNLGAAAEIVRDHENGVLFKPGDADDLAAKCQWLWNHPEECAQMGLNARREYELKYTPERNYEMLMAIYSKAMAGRHG